MVQNIKARYRLLFNLLFIIRKQINNPTFELGQLCILNVVHLFLNNNSLLNKASVSLIEFYERNSFTDFEKLVSEIDPSFLFIDYIEQPLNKIVFNDRDFKNHINFFSYLLEQPQEITEHSYIEVLKISYDSVLKEVVNPIASLKAKLTEDIIIKELIVTDCFSVNNKEIFKINLLAQVLERNSFISKRDRLKFELVFKGVNVKDTINWQRDASSLKYLIHFLFSINFLINNQNKWVKTARYFKVDGIPINPQSFRKLHRTNDCLLIDSILKNL